MLTRERTEDTIVKQRDRLNKLETNLKDFLFVSDDSYVKNLLHLNWDEQSAKRLAAWDWPHGIGLFCLWKRYLLTLDDSMLDYLTSWYDSRISLGLPEKNVNTVAPLLTLVFLDEKRRKPEWEAIIKQWALWIMNDMDRTPEGGLQHRHAELCNSGDLWDDTLFMTCLFLAKAGKLFNEPSWVDEASYQAMLHLKYLVDRKTGLWFHAWNFDRRDNYAGALWGRGNCWVTVFIPEFLEILQSEGPIKRLLIEALGQQIKALAGFQDESGLWHTLIDDPTSYLESSASAGFCAGMLKAIRKGYVPISYLPTAKKALNAILNEIDDNGILQHVSYGTNASLSLESYKNVPIKPMQYGQGLAMLAIIESQASKNEGIE